MKKLLLSGLLLLPLFINAQVSYSGSLHPVTMNRTSDYSAINLPFRIAELEVGLTKGNFDFNTNSTLEYRWKEGEANFDLREAYLIWYPSWGELTVGKQIHAWGAVDGNNPTDNLNPYDYYFMFLPGTERKIGTVSGSVKYYRNELQLEAVIIPEHEPNRYPFGEKDFPITTEDPSDFIRKAKEGNEVGFRLQTTIGSSDMGLSYFSGRDRGFSLGGYNLVDMTIPSGEIIVQPVPAFCYRKTTSTGLDIVTFVGDFTLRGEGGYFKTKNDYWFYMKNKLEASYLQFAIQLEYVTPYDFTLSTQLIGNHVYSLTGKIYEQSEGTFSSRDATKNDFQTGMGTPFAMFTDLGLFLSTSVNLWDNSLEIRVNTFLDLKDEQSMVGGSVLYSPIENWEMECSVTQLMGAKNTTFNEIKDFSNLTLGIKYSF